MIDDAGQGDSTFAIHLSHALDVVNGHAGIEHDMANAWSADGSITVEQARHQLRNMLTIVSALVNQSLDGDEPTIASGREAASRIAMLTRISDLLLQPQTQLNDLHTLVSLALTEGGTGRIRISGPICPIGSAHAATLALALHELEVHALHNGALSTRDGYVECLSFDNASACSTNASTAAALIRSAVLRAAFGVRATSTESGPSTITIP
ncbi:hypothetical protein WR25_20992 [Diploscapter pachys]|uniref:histidine kinase n=1 Tax=Diploscapter pachys TaxID=2018661 RepID=A0A2A2K3Y0_9BILA|nr:hypothetical protein WR25_20992 [Diploscapter pachys]